MLSIPGGYRLYFIRNGLDIFSATSTDGLAWNVEPGVRLSTESATPASSSITACSVFVTTSGVTRMLYVALSSSNAYSVLSATSSDGLAFSKEPGLRLQFGGGAGFVDSPRVLVTPARARAYYVRDASLGRTPANFRVFSATSPDEGLTWTEEGQRLTRDVYQVAVATLTDGRVRLYEAAPSVAGSTASQVLSAASSDGLIFFDEGGVRLSTASGVSIGALAVFRATETFRWRMLFSSVAGSTIPAIQEAVTASPVPLHLSPAAAFRTSGSTAFTLTGEVFSPGASVTFVQGSASLAASGVTVSNDLSLSGSFNPTGAALGNYDAVVTNADGVTGRLTNALLIDFQPGALSLLDNLFHPLKGGKLTVTATVFDNGHVTAKLYTLRGQLVKTVFDQDVAAGVSVFTWAGDTGAGNTVASGLYLLHVAGPKLDETEKVLVVK